MVDGNDRLGGSKHVSNINRKNQADIKNSVE